jgi:hypothetical protein
MISMLKKCLFSNSTRVDQKKGKTFLLNLSKTNQTVQNLVKIEIPKSIEKFRENKDVITFTDENNSSFTSTLVIF